MFVAHGSDGCKYALKVLLRDTSDPISHERFLREVEIGTALRHPGIVQVLTHGEEGGRPYLVMELLENAAPIDRYVDEKAPSHLVRARLIMEASQAVQRQGQSQRILAITTAATIAVHADSRFAARQDDSWCGDRASSVRDPDSKFRMLLRKLCRVAFEIAEIQRLDTE